eukprot:GHVP01033764.1.p1 GENE.GHVP01033764.1~~GHVP01033764.1.p1  ORF type:complete len:123 (+),score=16.65 GHVP01033764.1:56-370(+)
MNLYLDNGKVLFEKTINNSEFLQSKMESNIEAVKCFANLELPGLLPGSVPVGTHVLCHYGHLEKHQKEKSFFIMDDSPSPYWVYPKRDRVDGEASSTDDSSTRS